MTQKSFMWKYMVKMWHIFFQSKMFLCYLLICWKIQSIKSDFFSYIYESEKFYVKIDGGNVTSFFMIFVDMLKNTKYKIQYFSHIYDTENRRWTGDYQIKWKCCCYVNELPVLYLVYTHDRCLFTIFSQMLIC